MAFSSPIVFHSLALRGAGKSRIFSLLSSFSQNRMQDAVAYRGMQTHSFSSVDEVPEFERDELHDDPKATEKDMALRAAISNISTDFCKESMLSLKRFFSSRHAPVISTGSLNLDLALGIGGLPKGRMVEIYGREASGKTTLALQVIKEAQKLGGYCAYFDVENAMDPTFAESIGINTENLLIAPPDSAENVLAAVNTLTKSGSVDVIVVDSVAALTPQCEIDVPFGSSGIDIQSRIMTQALRKIHSSLCQSGTLLIFVNQTRFNPKSSQGFGPMEEVTCGGNALKFYAAVRLGIKKMGLLKTKDEITGLGICVQVVKNKLAPAMKKAELKMNFGKGICFESEVLDLGCEHGVVLKEGADYIIEGKVFDDKYSAQRYLAENNEICDSIVMTLRNILFQRENKH